MIIITDQILPKKLLAGIRQSAIDGGFNTMTPPDGVLGHDKYKGMGFHGHHAAMHIAISRVMGVPIYPNLSFFRILTSDEDTRLIHSDRNDGSYTSITYLSEHGDEESGTEFYRHKETGLLEMPDLQEIESKGETSKWRKDMQDDSKWQRTDYVSGHFGRNVIFNAPLFHARYPKRGIGTRPEDARLIHVVHFEI